MSNNILNCYDNFLQIDLINKINRYIETPQVKRSYVWRTSQAWPNEVRQKTSPVAMLELPDQFTIPIHDCLSKTSITWNKNNLPGKSMYYLYPPGGYIGWHNDDNKEFSSMIYLNKVWKKDWGGLFLYENIEDPGIRAEIPTFNKCIITRGRISHGVSIVAPDAPLRRVIVTFGGMVGAGKGKND